jgi:hypothetical protein
VGDAVLLLGLRRGHLEIAAEAQLAIDDVEDRVGTPGRKIFCAAARPDSAAPFIGEQDLGAVVVERRRVPVGEVLVGGIGQAFGPLGVADVEQDAVA